MFIWTFACILAQAETAQIELLSTEKGIKETEKLIGEQHEKAVLAVGQMGEYISYL